MRTGRFITFEGPEGGGKTTQAKRLIKRRKLDEYTERMYSL